MITVCLSGHGTVYGYPEMLFGQIRLQGYFMVLRLFLKKHFETNYKNHRVLKNMSKSAYNQIDVTFPPAQAIPPLPRPPFASTTGSWDARAPWHPLEGIPVLVSFHIQKISSFHNQKILFSQTQSLAHLSILKQFSPSSSNKISSLLSSTSVSFLLHLNSRTCPNVLLKKAPFQTEKFKLILQKKKNILSYIDVPLRRPRKWSKTISPKRLIKFQKHVPGKYICTFFLKRLFTDSSIRMHKSHTTITLTRKTTSLRNIMKVYHDTKQK